MDHFLEEVVVKHKPFMQNIAHVFANIIMVLSALFGVMYLQMIFVQFNIVVLIISALFLGIAIFLYLYRDRLKTEYEYTFTNGDLDFAQVYNNQKRKSLGTMRVKNVEAFGPVDSEGFRKLINMPGIKRKNWFLNRDASLYYFYYQKENSEKHMIVFEPSEEMVEYIRKYLPHGVYQK
ncbi:MAG: hypothetical protein PUD63_10820 [Clostridia bacterium]|nr:hypothetical protein [Clostridia bacterium]MDD6041666.1 hypothetical protein [Clostridia bacterium]